MTGQDFQSKLDAIVEDLQTRGKNQTIEILVRYADNSTGVLPLSSDANGVVSVAQKNAIQAFVDALKPSADSYEIDTASYRAALDAFKSAQEPHEALMTAATAARKTLNDALLADANYLAAKETLEEERGKAAYVEAVANYKQSNVSENFGNLSDAKGKYLA